METNKKSFQIDGFFLKIIAIVLMTIDHVGMFLQNIENTMQIGNIFRFFGRISFPLIIFLIAEGVRYTRHFGKYILRLGIVAAIFMIGQIIIYDFNNSISDFYSPMLDLILIATSLYLLKRKDKYSFLTILPICYIILSFVVVNIERFQNITILWMPFFLRLPYAVFDILLGLAFFYAPKIAEIYMKSKETTENLVDTPYHRYATNAISAFAVIFITLVLYVIFVFSRITYWNDSSQVWACLAFIPLLFYSGKRGYNAKWFKYGAYAYLPLHLIIIYIIFAFI